METINIDDINHFMETIDIDDLLHGKHHIKKENGKFP